MLPDYKDFQRLCAYYGHTATPLTKEEFEGLVDLGVDLDTAYDIGCDVAAEFTLEEAKAASGA